MLFVLLLLIALVLDVLVPPPVTGSVDTLLFIADHKAVYITQQVLWIGPGYLMVLVFVALGVALAPVGRSWALLAGLLGALPWALSLAIPVSTRGSLILVTLSDRFVAAAPSERPAIVAAAETVVAENNTLTLTGPLAAIGLVVAGLAMTRGVFPSILGWLGVAAGVLGVAAELLRFVAPDLYLGALLQWVWLVWTGLVLLRLGPPHPATAPAPPRSEAGRGS